MVYFDLFYPKIKKEIAPNFKYTVFIKVIYRGDSYAMCGYQFSFDYIYSSYITILLNIVLERLKNTLDSYNADQDDVLYVLLSFTRVDTKILSEYRLDESYVKNNKIYSCDFNLVLKSKSKNIPIYANKSYLL